MMNVIFICVVYSKHPDESKTVNSFKCINFEKYDISPKLAVWDNSIKGYGINSLDNVRNSETFYFHNGKNEKLSTIYNFIIEKFSNEASWVVILDDDSILTYSYVSAMCSYFSFNEVYGDTRVAVPKIFNRGVLISPGIVKGVRGHALANINHGLSEYKNLVAMMSGTVLCIKNLEMLPKFDERLGFYGIDTKFFKDISKSSSNVYIMPVEIEHESSLRDNNLSFNDIYQRLSNLFKSKYVIFEDVPFNRLRIKAYLLVFIVNKIIKTRDIRFLKLLRN